MLFLSVHVPFNLNQPDRGTRVPRTDSNIHISRPDCNFLVKGFDFVQNFVLYAYKKNRIRFRLFFPGIQRKLKGPPGVRKL